MFSMIPQPNMYLHTPTSHVFISLLLPLFSQITEYNLLKKGHLEKDPVFFRLGFLAITALASGTPWNINGSRR